MVRAFTVTPSEGVRQGDTVEAAWQAEGIAARLCIANQDYYGGQCTDVPLSGTRRLDITWPEGVVNVSLVVDGSPAGNPPPQATAAVEIDLGCAHPWALDALRESRRCPGVAETWNAAAAQPFERGWMIYSGSSYVILLDAPFQYAPAGKQIVTLVDPLDVTRDTSGQVTPPAGRLAPVSGFGIVWRGDASQSPGFRDSLGWALQPEFNYRATYQCWGLRGYLSALGGISDCYLTHPEGWVVQIVQNGWWLYWQPLGGPG
jgi:hypothetical protein